MKTSKTINRDSIYVGQLAKIYTLMTHSKEKPCIYTPYLNEGDLYPANFVPYRSIIFTLDEDNLCNDLLYESPKYGVLNYTDNNEFWSLMNNSNHWDINYKIAVSYACNLGELLKNLGFNENLTIEDINIIIKSIFNKKFLSENYENFDLIGGKYWRTIFMLSNDQFSDFFKKGFNINLNAFKPDKKEYKSRKLTLE